MDKFDYNDRIETFLEGETSIEEKEAFNKALAEDHALKQAFDDYLMGKDALGFLVRDEVRDRVGQLEKVAKIVHMPNPFRRKLSRIVGLTAIGLVIMISYANFQFTDKQLIYTNLVVPPMNTVRGIENTDVLSMALIEHDNHNYQKSNELCKTIDSSEKGYGDAQTLSGINLLYLDQTEEAVAIFKNGTNDSDQFNLAISYLNGGDELMSKQVLSDIISNPDHGYVKEAKKLERKLNSFFRKLVF